MTVNEKLKRIELSGNYMKNKDDILNDLTVFIWSTGASTVSVTIDWAKTGNELLKPGYHS